MTLKAQLVRLAHANPDLRPHILPLLKEGGQDPKWKARHDPELAFMEAMSGCRGHLKALDQALTRFERKYKREPQNWGYAGSLREVDRQLGETLQFLRG